MHMQTIIANRGHTISFQDQPKKMNQTNLGPTQSLCKIVFTKQILCTGRMQSKTKILIQSKTELFLVNRSQHDRLETHRT
jgi:hypothetical protein